MLNGHACTTVTVGPLSNISEPEFIGPIYTEVDYYFICRVIYTDTVLLNFDVTLTFDGELEPGVVIKTVSSTSSLDVIFTPQDFAGQFGKLVCRLKRCIMTIETEIFTLLVYW